VPARPYSRADLNSVDGTLATGFAGPAKGRGWYQDGRPGEKIITDVAADVQTVVYSFSKSTVECENILTSTLFARDFTTGSSVLQPQGGGDPVASISDVGAVAGVALIQGASGDVRLQVTTTAASKKYGQVFSFGVKLTGGPSPKHRVSWRLINRD
jgi:hypothetical protein